MVIQLHKEICELEMQQDTRQDEYMRAFLKSITKGNVKVITHWSDIWTHDWTNSFRMEAFDPDHVQIQSYEPSLCHQCMMFYCAAWTYGYTCSTCNAPHDEKTTVCRGRYGSQCRNKYSEHCLIRKKKLDEVEKLKEQWDFSDYTFTMRLKGRTSHKFVPLYYIPSQKGDQKIWIIDMGCRGHYYYSWIDPKEKFRALQRVLPVYPEHDDWEYWHVEWLHRYWHEHNNLQDIIFDLEIAELLDFKIDFKMNCKAYHNLTTPFEVGSCPYKCDEKIPLFKKHLDSESKSGV